MGKSGMRNGFVETERECCDIGLGLMRETQPQSFPRRKMNQMVMVMPRHHPHHESQVFCSGGLDGGTAIASSNSGPLFYNRSNNKSPEATDIYNAVSSDFSSVVVPKTLHQQPNYSDSLSFSSSGGGMVNVNVRIPFTPAQREELETQTAIYKYIMARLPVPQQLLFSIANNPPNVREPTRLRGVRDILEGFSKSMDPEPWRCKRTDGKKWRCSRDIAVDQKYCERHCHKRRSRKHVESLPNFISNNKNVNANMLSPKPSPFKNNGNSNSLNHQTPFSNTMVTTTASCAQPRALEWFMNGESSSVSATSNQEWKQLMPFKLGLNSHTSKQADTDVNFPKQQNESSQSLYRGGTGSHGGLQSQRSHDNFRGSLNSSQAQQTRHFIDAWSGERDGHGIDDIGKKKRCSVPLNQKLPFSSSLNLSMSGENIEANVESGNRQMGVEVLGSERQNVTQWMNPLSWMSMSMSSPPGGPLAEALCLGIASSTRATPSSNGCRSSNADGRQEFDFTN